MAGIIDFKRDPLFSHLKVLLTFAQLRTPKIIRYSRSVSHLSPTALNSFELFNVSPLVTLLHIKRSRCTTRDSKISIRNFDIDLTRPGISIENFSKTFIHFSTSPNMENCGERLAICRVAHK